MNSKGVILAFVLATLFSFKSNLIIAQSSDSVKFKIDKDLLLVNFDCKTDVDDIHSAAALITLLSNPAYSKVNYHAVAGTYGTQKGLYVPPNDLFQMAFDAHWSDAHTNWQLALKEVKTKAITTLKDKGEIWIADAGQSDFSADLVKELQTELSNLEFLKRIHIVQHSDWNEKVTSPEKLAFVKAEVDYQKIPDGNVMSNGTPGFRTPEYKQWESNLKDERLKEIWKLAVAIGIEYNGKDGRYNNEAIAAGGLDFSDISEVCWILGIQDIKDTSEFFELFGGTE